MRRQKNEWQEQAPAELRQIIGESAWQEISIGCSAGSVFRTEHGYLKIAPLEASISLHAEKERLLWLQGRLPVPQVYYFGSDAVYEYMLTSEIAGTMACDHTFKDAMPALIRLLAEGLRTVHAVATAQCPFDQRLDRRLAQAESRVRNGLVDEARLSLRGTNIGASDLYAHLLQTRPSSEDVVFTHGDFSLPNIIIDSEHAQIAGFIDLGYGGRADRYYDLALACRSLAFNFDQSWIPVLLAAYGLDTVDYQKIAFYQLLDQLF